MELNSFLTKLTSSPESIQFEETISVIEANYTFSPSEFKNGEVMNLAGENNGSCKIFAFGNLQQLSVDQTLACFGQFYRKDVLEFPENEDHQNIRNFIKFGWEGVQFSQQALANK
ncbi:HopJ type III effector protein [Vibrio kagoshimensis]|uniref:HopJ type III effector protein n=1 Tax=Vibrio kagoshimensis TaxID=2910244 RepID=UPI003D205951